MDIEPLILRKREERRLRAGHRWVFSNEVDTARTPLTAFEPGQPVRIQAADGKVLGLGYVNPASLICARLVTRNTRHPLDRSLIVHRLNVALALRQRLYPEPYYRLVHGDADGLPGLVVDRFGDVLVAQLNTAGMDRLREEVLAALDKVLKPRAIVLRNDSGARRLEGLEQVVEAGLGEIPEQVQLVENGVPFTVPLLDSQKTGWFFDHRENRARMSRYVKGARVLDVFSYLGGWGIQAAAAGAEQVTCIEASAAAAEGIGRNAQGAGVADHVSVMRGDAFELLKGLREEKARFDVVILDPPAFIKRKKDVKSGLEAYRRLNRMAMQLLGKDGILVSASCSYHLQRDVLVSLLGREARHLDRTLQILEQGHQGPDHPVDPAIPETDYLKCYIGRVVLA